MDRFRHYIKRIHDVDTKRIFNGDNMTCSKWITDVQAKVKVEFIWAVGPGSMHDMTMTDNNEDPKSLKFEQLIKYFINGKNQQEYLMK